MGGAAVQLLEQAQQASAAGKSDQSIELLKAALELEPNNPTILNMLANRLSAAGDGDTACDLLERATRIDPSAGALWLNLAAAERQRRNAEGEERALNRALEAEPYLVPALVQKGELFESQGKLTEASRAFGAALTVARGVEGVPPGLRPRLQHAFEFVDRYRADLAGQIRTAAGRTGATSRRFDYLVDIVSGQAQLYLSQPTRLTFPGLPSVAYFDRELFPWFGKLESATAAIRDELLGVMSKDEGMRPYIDIAATDPVNQWDKLNRSLDWSAYFLWENGRRNEKNCAACPITTALIESLPLFDIPDHAPTAMFSILRPGAHIPPHNGDTNIRAVVHLPLVVPPGCDFRVGAEIRSWVEGVAWAFDDTIEHEAWNRSSSARAILIVDAWNPYLSADERTLLRATEQVLKSAGKPS